MCIHYTVRLPYKIMDVISRAVSQAAKAGSTYRKLPREIIRYTNRCVCIYIYIYIHTYIHIYIYIYIYIEREIDIDIDIDIDIAMDMGERKRGDEKRGG